MNLKQLLADTASQHTEILKRIDEDKVKAKELKAKINKIQKGIEAERKLIESLK